MDSLASFLQMGGYAVYVWTSYAVTAAVLAGLLVATLRTLRARADGPPAGNIPGRD